jgi:hypothetical protein
MRTSNVVRKVQEWLKRKRQREIVELKRMREAKKNLLEVITKEDYHPSWHVRHWK